MNSVYIDSAVAATPIYIGPNNASSVIIGNANCTTALVGTVNIQNDTIAGDVNIKSGTTASGSVNIANSTGTVTTNIGAGGGTGIITIGGSSNTTTINSATINANGTLTMGAARNIVLRSNGVAPTDGTQLGGQVIGTLTAVTFASGYITATLTIVTPGIYIFNYNIQLVGTGFLTAPVVCYTKLVGTNAKNTDNGSSVVNNTNLTSVQTQVILATASVYNVTANFGATVTSRDANSFFNATRIG